MLFNDKYYILQWLFYRGLYRPGPGGRLLSHMPLHASRWVYYVTVYVHYYYYNTNYYNFGYFWLL